MDLSDDEEVEEMVLRVGIFMGRPLYHSARGGSGCVYNVVELPTGDPKDNHSHSPWVVKQNGRKWDEWESVNYKEYSIAHFLETNLPSFVAGPFGLMRGLPSAGSSDDKYDAEKLSLIQHKLSLNIFF
jgi:hypothetical protein